MLRLVGLSGVVGLTRTLRQVSGSGSFGRIGEQGMPGLNAGVHFMIYAPAKTPKDLVAMLSAELRKIIADPALKQRFINIGFDPTPTSSEDMTAIMRKTAEDWIPVIRRLNIKLD